MKYLKGFSVFAISIMALVFSFVAYAGEREMPNEVIYAKQIIKVAYGHDVSFFSKSKSLRKFGRNDDIGTAFETVWQRGGDETYVSTNIINKFSSSNAGDTQTMVVEGHTCTDNVPTTFVVQVVTVAGQVETDLTTALCRVNRAYNTGATDFAGTVYIYEDDTVTAGVPQTAAKIHAQTNGANNQTLKAATSLSSSDYWVVTEIEMGVNRQNSRSVDFRFQVREAGKVFRTAYSGNCHTNAGTCVISIDPPLIIKPSSDVRVRAISSGTTTGVEASLNGYLGEIR